MRFGRWAQIQELSHGKQLTGSEVQLNVMIMRDRDSTKALRIATAKLKVRKQILRIVGVWDLWGLQLGRE